MLSEMASSGQLRRSSHAASTTSGSTAGLVRKGVSHAEFEFNLGYTKGKVMKALEDKLPLHFKKFYNSQLYDRMLQACLLYLISKFQHDWVTKAMEKARKTHLEGYNPYAVAARLAELEEDAAAQKLDLSPIYSEIILKFSTYQKPQQDKVFFEGMYETLNDILEEAFSKLNLVTEIEEELGLLFRSRHFNLAKRQNRPLRSVDTLSVKELYSLKHETSNRALNAKMLTSLYEKPETLGVTVASVTNSVLIKQFITSPIVARSMMKDPQEREEMFEKVRREANPHRSLKNLFKTTARLNGVDVSGLRSKATELKPSQATADLMGIVPLDRAYGNERSRHRNDAHGQAASESVGLPVDEQYNYLVMLRRYVLYGPSLGMAPPQVPGLNPMGAMLTSGASIAGNGSPDGRMYERGGSINSSNGGDRE